MGENTYMPWATGNEIIINDNAGNSSSTQGIKKGSGNFWKYGGSFFEGLFKGGASVIDSLGGTSVPETVIYEQDIDPKPEKTGKGTILWIVLGLVVVGVMVWIIKK